MAKTKATEQEFKSQVISWIKEQISHGGLPFENATGDSSLYGLPTVRFPDVLLCLDFECQQPFCGWELKTPKTGVRDKELLKDAVEKAQTLEAKYFVTWNMQIAIIWKTPPKIRKTVKESDKVQEFGPDYRITDVNDVRDRIKAELLIDMCRRLLLDLGRLYEEESINLPVADRTIFVDMVSAASERMAETLLRDITKAKSTKSFNKRLNAWAKKQGVSKYDQDYYHTLAQQMSYKIIGKILFYLTLRRQNLHLLKMELRSENYKTSITKMRQLFRLGLEVDYQAIFEQDITDEIELSKETAKIIIQLTENLAHWTFEMMHLDVIGSVLEKLVPQEARHSLGQYFTPDNLVDLIVSFCVRSGGDFVMDPTCGTGTFLIRSYNRLRNLGAKRKPHHKLLEQLWGFDIAGFPAELATINLYRQDLSDYLNFPRVLAQDFFEVLPGQRFKFPPPRKTASTGERIEVEIPKFDALVGNFPYIRQELIEKAAKGYKKELEHVLVEGWGGKYTQLFKDGGQIRLSGQADIYAYLFFHAATHLKDGGRMGFVTSNSWLDVAYGYELQRFFLSKFKIVAICESRCEPWFEQSAVNTVFTILERSDDQEANKNNPVRFVKAKKPLGELFHQDPVTDSQSRSLRLEQFVDKIEEIPEAVQFKHSSEVRRFSRISEKYVRQPEIISYEDDEVRVRMIRQSDLKEEVEHAGQTVKWGQYLRAPDIYFEILEKCADKFVPLAKVADIRFGIKTGINEFFYLTEDEIRHWGIEKEFLKPVIKSPKECSGIRLKEKDLKFYAFLCHKDKSELKGTGALKHIKWGESKKTKEGRPWPNVESVKGRKNWYELPKRKPGEILLAMTTGSNLRAILNDGVAQVDHRLFEVLTDDKKVSESLGIYLNSGLAFLCRELIGRANLGDGALDVEGIDWKRILVPQKDTLLKLKKHSSKAFEKISKRSIKEIKTEAKRKDRIEFEKGILRTLGLSEELASDILAAVVGLVDERHLLPKLRKSKKKKRVEQDYEKMCEEISEEILPSGPIEFPEGFVKGWPRIECEEKTVPGGELKLGESFFDKQEICDAEGQHVMEVSSLEKGKFIVYAKKKSEFVIKVPESSLVIKKAVQNYEIYLKEIRNQLFKAIMEKCGDYNKSENLMRKVFEDFGLPDIR